MASEDNKILEFTCEDLQDFKDAFAEFDENRDSCDSRIKLDDLQLLMRTLGQTSVSSSDLDRLLDDAVCPDDPTDLDFPTFLSCVETKIRNPCSNKELQRAFDVFDRAHTGYITFEDMKEIANHFSDDISYEELNEIFNEFDRDHDHKLSMEDFIEMMKEF